MCSYQPVFARRDKSRNFWQMFQGSIGSGHCRCYSGVDFNLTGPLREEGQDGEPGMSRVVTPIFFSDDSSVTEMERVKLGRIAGSEPEKKDKAISFCLKLRLDLMQPVARVEGCLMSHHDLQINNELHSNS